MKIAEKEALTRLCPLAKRDFQTSNFDRCVASSCMLWRWNENEPTRSNGNLVFIYGHCGLVKEPKP